VADELVFSDATEQARAIRTGETTATALTSRILERIGEHNETLRAYVSVDAERAMQAAQAADDLVEQQGPDALPPFLGVTMSIKDVIGVKGLPTTQSSKALADAVAAEDHPLVQRFRQAGFTILGTTNLSEFCSSLTWSDLNGLCRNPWDLDRTPGGSSGGAAAALAAGLCGMSHGTDGAGSTRVPAAFCGLIGLKSTRGLISFGPERGENYYGSSGPGIMTRSVRDAAAGLDVMIGTHSPDPAWSPRPSRPFVAQLNEPLRPLRIAVCTTFPFGAVDSDVVDRGVRPVADVLAASGHTVEEAAPEWVTILAAASLPMSMPGPAAAVDPADDDKVEPRNRVMLQRMRGMTVLDHSREVERARAAARDFARFWDTYDVLLTPAFGTLPPAATWARWDMSFEEHSALLGGIANFAWPFNVSGQPAISVPMGWTADGLPVGVQLAGRHLEEGLLLRLAAELEKTQLWAQRTPPAFS
jgi:amidase